MSNIISEPTRVKLDITKDLTIELEYKELMGKKAKALGKKYDGINKIKEDRQRVARRLSSAKDRLEVYREQGDNKRVLDMLDKIDDLYDRNEELDKEYEKLGGIEVYEKFSKEQFNLSVSVKDEKIMKVFRNWIEEEYSYFSILQIITEKVIENRGK